MNRFFYGFIAFIFLFLSIYPFSNVFADDLIITGTPIPVQGDLTDEQLKDILVAGITADLVSQGYEIDLSASDGDWDNFKNSILDVIFNRAASGSGFIGEIYNSALYHNLINEDFTIWYPDTSSDSYLPGISKRSIYRNLSDGLISNLSDSRNNNPSPSPSPDSNYLNYIRYINSFNYDLPNNFVMYYFNSSASYPNHWLFNGDGKDYSWVSYTRFTSLNGPNEFNFSVQNSICYQQNGLQYTTNVLPCDPLTIYINGSDSNYSFNVDCNFITNKFVNEYDYTYTMACCNGWTGNWYRDEWFIYPVTDDLPSSNISYSGTLERCMMYIVQNFRNVNIYVNGVPWSIVFNSSLPTVVINPGYILQGTDYPLQYNFPEPPSFDYQRMIDIIKHALLQYGVIQWEDIADVFVDVNGQTAVAVLSIHRNDYDVLYDEQYPGIALPNRFNTHLLDTSHQYLSPVVQTVEETTGVLPGEIKGALAIGMMLTIFACLIHRLLE